MHLDGSLRVGTLIDISRSRGVALPSMTEEGMNALVFKPHYASLAEYLQGFAWTCAAMQDPEALERVTLEQLASQSGGPMFYI